MITIFTIPKSFEGNIGIAQENSIRSWLAIVPRPEVILFGDEKGVSEMASKLNVTHLKDVKKNSFGTPLLGWAFNKAKEISKNDILVYINSDIILDQDFMSAVDFIKQSKLDSFLMSGQRIDLDLYKQIDFSESNWKENIHQLLKEKGKLHSFSGMDYFIFSKGFKINLPEFAVGVSGWDSWLVYKTKSLKMPFIDATQLVTAIHQNHPPRNMNKSFYEDEKIENFKLAGGQNNMLTLREADFILTKDGLQSPKFARLIFSKLALFQPWRLLLLLKRETVDKFLGRSI